MRMKTSQTASVALHAAVVFALIHLSALQQLPRVDKQPSLTWSSTKLIYHLPKGDSRGGGGGPDLRPPSKGELPQVARRQLILPTTKLPDEVPALPVEPTILGENVSPRVPAGLIGDPHGVPGPPSDGMGRKGGIGTNGCCGAGNQDGPSAGDGPGGRIVGIPAGGLLIPPSVITQVEPEFTEEARKARMQGTVVLHVEVDEQGRAQKIEVRQPLGLGLDERAIEAVRKWRFRPARQNGRPVKHPALIEVHFHLL